MAVQSREQNYSILCMTCGTDIRMAPARTAKPEAPCVLRTCEPASSYIVAQHLRRVNAVY